MPISQLLEISKLSLDLRNFRTTPQPNEEEAIKAMISIRPDWFYALMQSLITDGYLLTENIIILKVDSKYIVKEGNRRVAIMKILHGHYNKENFGLPSNLITEISSIDSNWKSENQELPCTIYEIKDSDKVDKIVSLAHGKGEKAGRDKWTSVARARHNRDEKKSPEPVLDLLEKYIASGKNLTGQQKDRWAGDFPLTVMEEAIKKILPRIGFATMIELSKKYPSLKQRNELETLIRDIGLELLTFPMIRNSQIDFAVKYGFNPTSTGTGTGSGSRSGATTGTGTTSGTGSASGSGTTSGAGTTSSGTTTSGTGSGSGSGTGSSSTSGTTSGSGSSSGTSTSSASSKNHATNDPRNVAFLLKNFNPKGANRQKVVTLRDEIKKLKIKDNPIAFCFLLRSMFEISAKVYCQDKNITTTKNGREKTLVDLLRSVM